MVRAAFTLTFVLLPLTCNCGLCRDRELLSASGVLEEIFLPTQREIQIDGWYWAWRKQTGKKEREISVATDGFDPGVLSPPPIPSEPPRKCVHGTRENGDGKNTASYTNMTFPADPGPALSSSPRAGRNDVKQQDNYLQQMGPPCSPHRVCAQSCCQPPLPGRG